jgi:hypothetical protein
MSELSASIADMSEFTMPDGRKVRITDRVFESFDEDHDDCPFCLGRAAAHRGEDRSVCPFPEVDFSDGATKYYETDYGLWMVGHDLGATEPGGLLWFEQPNRDTQ